MNPAKWLLSKYLKIYRLETKTNSGFSLIELLVAMIVAFLILTPLLTFMISIMDNDRKEQVKTAADQDLSATIDYIKRDLQQAVYIYDADGINSIRKYLPTPTTVSSNSFPVLVFWKRQFVPNALSIGSGSEAGTNDTYVYSLVAYYVINDNSPSWGTGTSPNNYVSRIGRFQIKNGYGATASAITSTTDTNFQLFNLGLNGTSLKTKMDQWTSSDGTGTYSQQVIPLVDYIDSTPINTTTNPKPTCPSVTETVNGTPTAVTMQIVPDFAGTTGGSAAPPSTAINNGFYVCVDSTNVVAEIHIRGNAYARLGENQLNYDITNSGILNYFPQKTTRVQGIGFLYQAD